MGDSAGVDQKVQIQTKRGYANFLGTSVKIPRWAVVNRLKFRATNPRSRRHINLKRKRGPALES